MLHHQYRVAQVPHLLEGVNELQVVPLVEADAGLIQHVEHALELGANLRSQADTLALAAGQRRRAAIQGEVAKAHVVQEAQPFADLLQHLLGDDRVLAFEGDVIEPLAGLAHALGHHLCHVEAAHIDREHLGLEPLASALLAGDHAHGLLHLSLNLLAGGLPVATLQVADDALEVVHEVVAVLVALALVGEAHLLLGAVQHQAPDLGG